METLALLVAIILLGAVIAEATLRAEDKYRRHFRELERLDKEKRK